MDPNSTGLASLGEEEETPKRHKHKKKKTTREDTVRRQPFLNQGEASGKSKPTNTASLDFQAPGPWEVIFCGLRPLVRGTVLWRPRVTNPRPLCSPP